MENNQEKPRKKDVVDIYNQFKSSGGTEYFIEFSNLL